MTTYAIVGAGQTAAVAARTLRRRGFDGRIELIEGAGDTVRAVSDVAPIAMASSAPRRVIDAVLTHHGLIKRFTATVSSAEVPRGKPSPDVYLAAAKELGVPSDRCFAVEDSSNGLRAAAAADMTVVALPNPTYPPAEDALTKAAYSAASLHDVRDYLLRGLKTAAAK